MNKKFLEEFANLLPRIKNKKQALAMLPDILTPKELASIVERWQIVKMLLKKVPHRKISKTLKVSIAKVTRGSHAVKKSRGGFRIFINK